MSDRPKKSEVTQSGKILNAHSQNKLNATKICIGLPAESSLEF